ncbi:MAG TPA: pyridoxal-phosphate dependent enzyme [Candidatus Dormibacteraeota bacterium]|nr:pyridoxal-phosphate dependent enzyme [Candidatus Dormibacteraeota bacterium]
MLRADPAINLLGIQEAARVVDPVFRDSPQFLSEQLSARLGVETVLKVETANPIRSFKGRGTDYLLHRLGEGAGSLVCASAGNFGQGMAYAARKRGVRLTVFAAESANPLKVERMRALGAAVVLEGVDFDGAKEAATRRAQATGDLYIEDGLWGPIAEGAATMAVELARSEERLAAVFVPLGNGSLVNGIGTWLRHASPATRVIAVCAEGAPAMEMSWREGRPVSTAAIDTIADGIAVRVPIAEALDLMRGTIDEVMLVSDEQILDAMRLLLLDAGLVVEPAGAAGLAAIQARREEFAGRRVATPLCGGNLTEEQVHRWLRP